MAVTVRCKRNSEVAQMFTLVGTLTCHPQPLEGIPLTNPTSYVTLFFLSPLLINLKYTLCWIILSFTWTLHNWQLSELCHPTQATGDGGGLFSFSSGALGTVEALKTTASTAHVLAWLAGWSRKHIYHTKWPSSLQFTSAHSNKHRSRTYCKGGEGDMEEWAHNLYSISGCTEMRRDVEQQQREREK